MSTTIYPGADRASQWFGGLYVGSLMDANNIVLHSTEGMTWPGYSGGAVAPHFTLRPDFATRTVKVRQHFAANRSARALVNLGGGVETNTLGCVQLELVGTCDYAHRDTWTVNGRTYKAGVDYIYMPAAPDWFLAGIAELLRWFDVSWPKFQLKDGAPRGWGGYPSSYGASKYRMSFSEWQANYGIVGHQHVPENAHGDPGAFPIAKLVQLATGAVTPTPEPVTDPTPTPVPAGPVWGQASTWKLGAQSPDVLKLGERINVWNEALGFPTWTPDDVFSSTERNDLSNLQVAWGFGSSGDAVKVGGASDGFPGAQTFAKLDSAPPPPPTSVTGLHWNIAGSNVSSGYKAENATRGDDVARWALAIGFEAFVTCEASQDDLRAGMNYVIGDLFPWEERAKAIWHKTSITKTAPRKAYKDTLYAYLDNTKWGAAIFAEKGGIPFSFLEVHTDYRDAAKQAKQLRSIFAQWRSDCDELGIKDTNRVVTGDLNWDGSTTDNPFHALDAYNFEEKGDRTVSTFRTGKHLDGVLAHKAANVRVRRWGRANEAGVNLSDHYPLQFVLTLT